MIKYKILIYKIINIYILILAAGLVVAVYLDLPNYLSYVKKSLQPKYIYYLWVLLITPVFILKLRYLKKYLTSYYVVWLMALVALNIFHYLFMSQLVPGDAHSVISTRVQYFILSIIVVFLLLQVRSDLLGWMFVATAIILVFLQIFDFMDPGRLLPEDTVGLIVGRASSTLINANKPGESLILLMILGMSVLNKNRRLWFALVVFIGIAVSFSRGNTLTWALFMVLAFALHEVPRMKTVIALLAGLFGIIVFAGVLLPFIMSNVDLAAQKNVWNRLTFFGTGNVGDYSTQSRIQVALDGLRVFWEAPIWGHGAAFTRFWSIADISTHNQHILFLVEYGIIGYFLFLYLFVLIGRGSTYFSYTNNVRLGRTFIPVLLLFGMFTHNMFDSLYWLVSYGIIGTRIYITNSHK